MNWFIWEHFLYTFSQSPFVQEVKGQRHDTNKLSRVLKLFRCMCCASSYSISMLLSLGHIFQMWQNSCTEWEIDFSSFRCIVHQNTNSNCFLVPEMPKPTGKSYSIRFKSMKLETPIIHTMKYDDIPKCAYKWSMTHIDFGFEHLFESYMNHFFVCPASVPTPLLEFSLSFFLFFSNSVERIHFFMSFKTLQPKCIMFRRYKCDQLISACK